MDVSRRIRTSLEAHNLWPPPFGQTFRIRGLKSAAGKPLNGRIVHMGGVDKDTGRLCVWSRLGDPLAEWKRVKLENLQFAEPSADEQRV